MKKLKLNRETVRQLGVQLERVRGGVYTGGDETVGYPGCESGSCPGSDRCPTYVCSMLATCSPTANPQLCYPPP